MSRGSDENRRGAAAGRRRGAKQRTIKVNYLARVEGEGAFSVTVKNGRVVRSELRIYEPPRFFEALLAGRGYEEAPDITARICGICPAAYQMSACRAVEHAAGVTVTGPLGDLRRLLYCGEWIESHTLHIYMLHAPDFLGYAGAVEMARDHRQIVERGLQLKKAGNSVMALLGGREVHPINVRTGGFYRAPSRTDVRRLTDPLKWARDAAHETVRWVSGFEFPELELDVDLVSLSHGSDYPMNEGRIVSDGGLDIAVEQFDEHFVEHHVAHSTALQGRMRDERPYLVGPLARYSLNYDRLTPRCHQAAREAGLGSRCKSPFRSIIVRAVEVLYACEEALRIVEDYQRPEQPAFGIDPRGAIGHGCTEAPRGLLYHRYEIDENGKIASARIVPPTAQNQPSIERDLERVVEAGLQLPTDELTWRCEQTIRNYDPCISCATHFLRLELQRA